MDMRYNMSMQDGRNPYGSRGGYVVSSRGRGRRGRGRRGDRGMDYADYERDMARGGGGSGRGRSGGRGRDRASGGMSDMRGGDYNYDMARQGGMRNDYARQGGMDGHYPQGEGSTYYPIQAMGTFEGYYGMPEQDYARGGRGGNDYGYDMRYDMRGRDYGYEDYGEDYGDYGETLTEEEIEKWCKKLKGQLDEREKQMFSKETISQKAKSMGKQMEGFGEKELEVTVLMIYTDYKNTIGSNPDLAIKMAFDWLNDKDASVKGAEKLAVYYDCIVEGESD